jgi:hypothetical protein
LTGLKYTYSKNPGPGTTNAWYSDAIDFHMGETIYKVLAGTGILYNSNYSILYLGPVVGNLMGIHDSY